MTDLIWMLKTWWIRMTWDPKRHNPPEYWALIARAVMIARATKGYYA